MYNARRAEKVVDAVIFLEVIVSLRQNFRT
jgi:hypothetical protein